MNERIRELVEQAGAVTGTDLTNVTDALVLIGEEEIQAFAELIVEECASMARVYCAHEFDFTGDLKLDEFMLKHFGVEE